MFKSLFVLCVGLPLSLSAQFGLLLDGGIGYRTGDYAWNIGSYKTGPDVVSELRWQDLKAIDFYVEGQVPYMMGKLVGFELHYAPIYSGSVTDADFALSGRKGEYSRSRSDSNRGYLVDLILKNDYIFPLYGNQILANLTGGYCYHKQHLFIQGGEMLNNIDPNMLGPLKGLNSRYSTLWSGIFIGTDLIFTPTYPLLLTVGYRYQYLNYHAKGHWNLRKEFAEPFSHSASNGWGNIFFAKLSYTILSCFILSFQGQVESYAAKNGTDETSVYTNEGIVIFKGRLNRASWNTRVYFAHLGFSF